MKEDKSKGDIGCAIIISIFFLLNLIYFFATKSKSEIANSAAGILTVTFPYTTYFIIKACLRRTKHSNNKLFQLGIPIGLFILLVLIYGRIVNNFTAMLVLGTIVYIVSGIALGIWIYHSMND